MNNDLPRADNLEALKEELALLQALEAQHDDEDSPIINRDLVATELYATYEIAIDAGHYQPVVKALELLGKHLGMFDGKGSHIADNTPRAILYMPDNQRFNNVEAVKTDDDGQETV